MVRRQSQEDVVQWIEIAWSLLKEVAAVETAFGIQKSIQISNKHWVDNEERECEACNSNGNSEWRKQLKEPWDVAPKARSLIVQFVADLLVLQSQNLLFFPQFLEKNLVFCRDAILLVTLVLLLNSPELLTHLLNVTLYFIIFSLKALSTID